MAQIILPKKEIQITDMEGKLVVTRREGGGSEMDRMQTVTFRMDGH